MIDSFRKLHPQKIAYTWKNPTILRPFDGGLRVDYILVS